MAYTNELQLLPEKRAKVELRSPGKTKLFTWGVILVILVVAAGFFLMYLKSRVEQQIVTVDMELAANEAKRDKKFEGEVVILKKQLGLVSGLLKNHVYWSLALTAFENTLLERVQITLVDLKKSDNKIKFSGLAANYSVIAKQIASFSNNEFFTEIVLGGVKVDNSGLVEFTMDVKVNPNKLIKNGQ